MICNRMTSIKLSERFTLNDDNKTTTDHSLNFVKTNIYLYITAQFLFILHRHNSNNQIIIHL